MRPEIIHAMSIVISNLRAAVHAVVMRCPVLATVIVSVALATTAQGQWVHRYNQVATLTPVYGRPAPSSTSDYRTSKLQGHASSPTVAYGGDGPRAQLLPQPGAAARPQRPRIPYRQASLSSYASSPGSPGYGQPIGEPSYGQYDGFDDGDPNARTWELLPEGLIYPSYLAGVKEPRMGAVANYEANDGWKFDFSIGGRLGVFRYGTMDVMGADGWQLDVEAGAQPRLDPEQNMDLEATDFRFGIPLTYGRGRYRMKIAYFHLSSHLGDEYALRNGFGGRLNYSRDAINWGHSYRITESLTGYCEVGFGFKIDVNEPWDVQFGFDYSPPCECGFRGTPFFAVNAHLREEVDFGGNGVLQAGWQWRSRHEGHLLRVGAQYYNGKHERYEFFDTSEQKVGLGIWYDF